MVENWETETLSKIDYRLTKVLEVFLLLLLLPSTLFVKLSWVKESLTISFNVYFYFYNFYRSRQTVY